MKDQLQKMRAPKIVNSLSPNRNNTLGMPLKRPNISLEKPAINLGASFYKSSYSKLKINLKENEIKEHERRHKLLYHKPYIATSQTCSHLQIVDNFEVA